MNILALDFGLRRIGVAFGSSDSGIALPRPLIFNDESLFLRLSRILEEDDISLILVGMPYMRDGSQGALSSKVNVFVESLRNHFDKEVLLFDERYSTRIAESKLRDAGIKAKNQMHLSDSVAAQVILQEYLESLC